MFVRGQGSPVHSRRPHGGVLAGSRSAPGNWHSILRTGLKNASGTALMSAGAAYGAGIYLATDSMISAGHAPLDTPSTGYPDEIQKKRCGSWEHAA